MKQNFDSIVQKTNLKYPLFKRGKVRDIYELDDKLLIVSTDRISAFDIVLPNGIPYKGIALNLLSAHWFEETKDIVQNHLLKIINSRSILVRRTDPMKFEFVVRGYLYGSAAGVVRSFNIATQELLSIMWINSGMPVDGPHPIAGNRGIRSICKVGNDFYLADYGAHVIRRAY